MANVKIGLTDSTLFKDCIATINGLVSEVSITLDNDGLGIIAMDPANVAMCVFKMNKAEFLEWTVSEPTEIGVKLSDLKQILSRGDKNSTLYLQVVDNKLQAIMVGKNGKKKEFSLSLISMDEKKHKMPDLKFTAEIVLDNAVLKDAIADVEILAESMSFKIADKKFSVAGAGDVNSVKSEVEANVTCEAGVTFQSKYSIEYLNKFVSSKVSKNVKLGFSKDYPSKFTYLNDKGTTSMIFILAPRIENT